MIDDAKAVESNTSNWQKVQAAISKFNSLRRGGLKRAMRVVATIKQSDRSYQIMENGEYRRANA
jgi:hypothetical protein